MMSTMSDFINHQLIHLRTKLQEKLKTPVPDWFIPLGWISIDQSEYRVLKKINHDWNLNESLYKCRNYIADSDTDYSFCSNGKMDDFGICLFW